MSEEGEHTDEEAASRRDEVIKRMLNTPPQPRTAKLPKKKPKTEKSPRKAT